MNQITRAVGVVVANPVLEYAAAGVAGELVGGTGRGRRVLAPLLVLPSVAVVLGMTRGSVSLVFYWSLKQVWRAKEGSQDAC